MWCFFECTPTQKNSNGVPIWHPDGKMDRPLPLNIRCRTRPDAYRKIIILHACINVNTIIYIKKLCSVNAIRLRITFNLYDLTCATRLRIHVWSQSKQHANISFNLIPAYLDNSLACGRWHAKRSLMAWIIVIGPDGMARWLRHETSEICPFHTPSPYL